MENERRGARRLRGVVSALCLAGQRSASGKMSFYYQYVPKALYCRRIAAKQFAGKYLNISQSHMLQRKGVSQPRASFEWLMGVNFS